MTPSQRLTRLAVEAVKPKATRFELPDSKVTGLRLIVQPSGAKSWAVRYTAAGRDRRLTIGSYPTISLDEARKQASAAKRAVMLGEDPAADKQEARRIAAAGVDKADLLETVWDEYRKRHLSTKRESTAAAAQKTFTLWVRPKLGKRRIGEIAKRDVLGILDDLVKAGYPSAANRARAVLTAFFNWALARDILQSSPCAGIKPPSAIRSRDRVLSDDELRWLWKACEADPFPFGGMIQLLILTGARREEVNSITDKELNLTEKLWKLPAERSKNHREHVVHLSETALAVIEAIPRVKNKARYLFCTTGEMPPSGFSRAKRRIDKLMLKHAKAEAESRGDDPSQVEIQGWVLHDLRRTMASGMARLGIQLPVIERCLNHVSGSFAGIVGVYQRHTFADEKKIALDTWSKHLEQLVGVKPRADNVAVLQEARRRKALR